MKIVGKMLPLHCLNGQNQGLTKKNKEKGYEENYIDVVFDNVPCYGKRTK